MICDKSHKTNWWEFQVPIKFEFVDSVWCGGWVVNPLSAIKFYILETCRCWLQPCCITRPGGFTDLQKRKWTKQNKIETNKKFIFFNILKLHRVSSTFVPWLWSPEIWPSDVLESHHAHTWLSFRMYNSWSPTLKDTIFLCLIMSHMLSSYRHRVHVRTQPIGPIIDTAHTNQIPTFSPKDITQLYVSPGSLSRWPSLQWKWSAIEVHQLPPDTPCSKSVT